MTFAGSNGKIVGRKSERKNGGTGFPPFSMYKGIRGTGPKERKSDMELAKKTCEAFVEELASGAPVPGGGGASALVGALGAALGNMVGSLTVGKKKYAAVEADILHLKERASMLQNAFLELIDADAEGFAPLAAAYSMPKETPEQREEKARVMESALKDACAAPFAILERCSEALDVIGEFAGKGARLAVSDAGVAALLCRAAAQGASLNVYVNTKLMADRAFAGELNARTERLTALCAHKADEIYASVRGQLVPGEEI